MCESQMIRYVHVMKHEEYPDNLRVGCECAAKMEEDPKAAYTREKTSKNFGQRRARWAGRSWRPAWEDGEHYRALEVRPWSNTQEIKSAYRKLVFRCHPDRNPGDRAAEEEFKRVAQAYEILSDPQKRARYDKSGGTQVQVLQLNVNRLNIVLREGVQLVNPHNRSLWASLHL
jgi:DnaJ-domain-containing protein 1